MRKLHVQLAALALLLLSPAITVAVDHGDSQRLIAELLEANQNWLRTDVEHLSYTFHMGHTNRDDAYEIKVRYDAPDQVTIERGDKSSVLTIDNEYDPNNTAFPPRLVTILQGVTLFGPMQEVNLAASHHQVVQQTEEMLGERKARVLEIVPTGQPSAKAVARWTEKLTKSADNATTRLRIKAGHER